MNRIMEYRFKPVPWLHAVSQDVAAEQTMRNSGVDTLAAAEQPVSVERGNFASRCRSAEAAARKRRRLLGAAAVLALLVSGLVAKLAAVIDRGTDGGTFVIEAADHNVIEALRDQGIRVYDVKLGHPVTLQPGSHSLKSGEYAIDVEELPPKIEISTRKFQLKRGGRATLKVTMAKPGDRSPATVNKRHR